MKIKDLIKGALVYGGINIIQKSINIFLVPIYLAVLSIEDFGSLEIVIAIYAFFSHLFMLQMEGGFQRFFYDHKDPKKQKLYCFIIYSLLFLFVPHLSYNLSSFFSLLSSLFSLLSSLLLHPLSPSLALSSLSSLLAFLSFLPICR